MSRLANLSILSTDPILYIQILGLSSYFHTLIMLWNRLQLDPDYTEYRKQLLNNFELIWGEDQILTWGSFRDL